MDEIKRCPFCNGEPKIHEHIMDNGQSTFSISCRGCQVSTWKYYNTKKQAINFWNDRYQDKK